MRGITLTLLLACTLVDAAANDYVEVRDLSLDASGLRTLIIETGSGPLRVTGDPGAGQILARATITVPGKSEEAAKERIEKEVTLDIRNDGDVARLRSFIRDGMFSWGKSLHMELDVTVPASLGVNVEDGSGSMEVTGIGGPLRVEDGSGSIVIHDAGADVIVEDGSGGIEVSLVAGDVQVIDGSGSIRIEDVAGSVTVEDGSGSIDVTDVAADLIVEDSGSGSVRHRGVLGRVVIDE